MTDGLSDALAASSPPVSSVGPPRPGLVRLQEHPELIPIVTQAVDEVITSSYTNRDRDANLINDAEQAAWAAALITYERMVLAVIQASDAATQARRDRTSSVAATAEEIAEVVTDTAVEVHNVEEAAGQHVSWVAANAASALAALVTLEGEAAASTAAALVLKAVSEAAAVNTLARADAASNVAQAAAEAAAEAADAAACTALATEENVITNAFDRHQDALKTCREVAAAAAQAVLTHHTGQDLPPYAASTPY